MRKKWHHRPAGRFLGAGLAALLIRFLCGSQRWHQHGRDQMEALLDAGKPVIIVFWHEHLLAMPVLVPPGCAVLQSPHPDGQMMARIVNWFGIRTVWGSSNRQASSGLRQMVRLVRDGAICVLTPDGPRGPARHMAAGPVAMAQLTGAAIVPVAWASTRCWRANSWDRLRIPKPFGRGHVIWGAPVDLANSGDKQQQQASRQLLAERLNQLAAEADQLVDQSADKQADKQAKKQAHKQAGDR